MRYRYDAGSDTLVVDLSPQEHWAIPYLCTTDGKTVLRLTGATVVGIEMLHASASYPKDWLLNKTRSETDHMVPTPPGAPVTPGDPPVQRRL